MTRHRATVGLELEVLAKKFDRFGWDRDRETLVHDRLMADWMAALQDYPLDEIQAACRAAVLADPKHMPNEGHIVAEIIKARWARVAKAPRPKEPEKPVVPFDAADRARVVQSMGDLVSQIRARAGK